MWFAHDLGVLFVLPQRGHVICSWFRCVVCFVTARTRHRGDVGKCRQTYAQQGQEATKGADGRRGKWRHWLRRRQTLLAMYVCGLPVVRFDRLGSVFVVLMAPVWKNHRVCVRFMFGDELSHRILRCSSYQPQRTLKLNKPITGRLSCMNGAVHGVIAWGGVN